MHRDRVKTLAWEANHEQKKFEFKNEIYTKIQD